MEKIKIAQIGINRFSHARDIFSTLKMLSDQFEIAGYTLVENEETEYADILKVFDGYPRLTLDEILNDPSITAVTVETEEKDLTRYALMAAQHHKHIHMEKPGGQNLSEFEALIAEVKKQGTVFHTGYMYRYNPYVQVVMQKVRNGELGDIMSVEAQMNCRHQNDNRAWLAGYKGGMMFFLGCHLIDLILQIQGDPLNIIRLNCSTGMDGIRCEDYGMVVFEYPHGLSFAKTCDTEIGGFSARDLVVSGTRGTIRLQPLEGLEAGGQYVQMTEFYDPKASWAYKGQTSQSPLFHRYAAMISSFGEMAAGKKTNPFTPDYELSLYKTILRCCGL